MPCDVELLSELDFFSLLNEEDHRALADVIDHITLDEGATLFHAGDPGDALYVVRSGAVELSVKDVVGQKIVLTVAQAGDMFGELALLDSEPRSATAIALAPCSLLLLDRDDLLLLFQKHPGAAVSMLAAMGSMTRKADELLQTRVSRNVNEEMDEQLTTLQRTADWIAWFSGSMPFLILNAVWFIIWIVLNTLPGIEHFDPYPFGLLTMIVSLEAIFLSCFVLVSQNRQAEKDHVRSDIEYEVNIKAELEVAHLHEKTDRLQSTMLERFSRVEKLLARTTESEKV